MPFREENYTGKLGINIKAYAEIKNTVDKSIRIISKGQVEGWKSWLGAIGLEHIQLWIILGYSKLYIVKKS